MITFTIGLLILLFGYIFYSKYVESQFVPNTDNMPCNNNYDGVDYVPLSTKKNQLIHLLNIAGIGPIMSALQGIVFGPIFFIMVPVGCILMGCVHDYFSGMLSIRHKGYQITQITKEYFGDTFFKIFTVVVLIMFSLWIAVFIYSAGDLYLGQVMHQTDFTFNNPKAIYAYIIVAIYFIAISLFSVNKMMAKVYPYITLLVIIGTVLLLLGFILHGLRLPELDIHHLNWNPKGLAFIPFFFMTVGCGLLSGSHGTQTAIVSRTLKSEAEGKKVFFLGMCLESVITMIWAAGALFVYNSGLIEANMIGKVNVVSTIAENFAPFGLSMIIVLAVFCLPLTSGDTGLRALRMVVADAFNIDQKPITNRLMILVPSMTIIFAILYFAKVHQDQFSILWRYVTLSNQLLVIPTFLMATIFLYKNKKNYFITLIPGLFYIFITSSFIFNAKIGFNLNLPVAELLGVFVMLISLLALIKKMKKTRGNI